MRALAASLVLCACVPRTSTTPIGVTPIQTGSFAGTFANPDGSIAIEDRGAGRFAGTFDSRTVGGTIEASQNGAQLVGTAQTRDGRTFAFVAYQIPSGIQISFDRGTPIRFTRTNRMPTAATTTPPTTPTTPVTPPPGRTIQPSSEPAPAPGTASAGGLVFRDELDGFEIRTPDAWKYVVRGTAVVFSSDAEPGLIVVTFQRGITADQLEPGVAPALAQLTAVQTGAPRVHRTKGGAAVIYELGAFLADGSEIRARAFAIAGSTGAISVLGIAQPAQLDGLRRRIDELAVSARFFSPPPNPAHKALAGAWSAGARTLELCATGAYFDSTIDERAATPTSKFHDAYTAAWTRREPGTGRWTATGGDADGSLRLIDTRGKITEHRYAARKRDLALDDQPYTRRAPARCP